MDRREFITVALNSIGGAAIGALGLGRFGWPDVLTQVHHDVLEMPSK